MSVLGILGKVGKSLIGSNPAGAAILGAVNAITGAKTVTRDMTGEEAEKIINNLPEDQRQKVLEAQIDLEATEVKENTEVVRALAEVDAAGASTRPHIAVGSFYLVALVTLLVAAGVTYTVITGGFTDADKVLQLGVGVAALLSPFIVWVNRYFGLRTREKESKAAVAMGQAVREEKAGLLTKISRALNG